MLDALRRRIRTYVWIDGLARSVAAAVGCLWASLVFDLFEPPAPIRVLLLIAGMVAVGYVAWRWLIQRLQAPLAASSLALLIERKFDRFDEGLVTAVELSPHAQDAAPSDRDLLGHVRAMADRQISSIDLDELLDPRPRNHSLLAAGGLLVALLGVAVIWPAHTGIWARRTFAFSGELYPRDTRLAVEGFDHGVAKVARGADFEVVALADASMTIPRYVQIRYRTEPGKRGRRNMSRDGDALADGEPQQRYSHTFQAVLSPIRLELRGGDARVTGLRIEVVEPPTLTDVRLACRFPDYLKKSPRELPVSGVMQLPRGSVVSLHARANKDLVKATLRFSDSSSAAQGSWTIVFDDDSEDRRMLTFDLGVLDRDRTLLIRLFDTDGIVSLEPIRISMLAVVDETPQVTARPHGIGAAVTSMAKIPFQGDARDDYAIDAAWFRFAVDDGSPRQKPLAEKLHSTDQFHLDEAFDVRDLGLEAGQKLSLAVEARDFYQLGDEGPQTGSTQTFVLDIVTPEALLALLETRELNLRRRFETILEEVTGMRNSLSRIKTSASRPPPADDREAADPPKSVDRKKGALSEAQGGELEARNDKPATATEPASPSALAPNSLRRLRIERALQNSRKNAGEILGLADAFDAIREELVNNRVDTEQLKSRLKEGIADPLRTVGDEMFKELSRRLERLKAATPETTEVARTAATRQADEILVAMQSVLEKMLELETFSEVVDLLRSIIQSQEQVLEQTQQRRKSRLRDLLE